MATGSIILSPGAATLPDGSASNAAPKLTVAKGSGTPPTYRLRLFFNDTTEQWCTFQFRMPDDYASSPVLKLQSETVATTGAVVWGAQIAATTPGDAVAVNSKSFATINSVTFTVPSTLGYMLEATITMTNADSLAAGDDVVLRVARVAADAADTAVGDALLSALALVYTTT